jgi:regulatory protein
MKGMESGEDDAAFAHSLLLLARREYCREEMHARLIAKGFNPAAVERALLRLASSGYLNEQRYAEGFLRSRIQRGDAPRLAAMKARQRGVDDAALQAVLCVLERSFDSDMACRDLLTKRDPAGLRFFEDKQWRRQARYLRSKGFDAETIMRAMREGKPEG